MKRKDLIDMLAGKGINGVSKMKLDDLIKKCIEEGLIDAPVAAQPEEEKVEDFSSLIEEASKFKGVSSTRVDLRSYNPADELKKRINEAEKVEEVAIPAPETVVEVIAEPKEGLTMGSGIKRVISRSRMFNHKASSKKEERKKGGKVMADTRKKLEFERVNASEMVSFTGIRVRPILKKEKDENGKEFDVYVDCDIIQGNIPVPKHHPHAALLKSGDLGVCRIYSKVPEHRKQMLNKLMDRLQKDTIEKYGIEKIVVTTKPHEANKLIFFGFKEVWDKVFACDTYAKDLPKLEGYCAPTTLRYVGEDQKINLLHIKGDIFKRTVLDGNINLNISMIMESFVSKKAWLEGKKAKMDDLYAVQIRATGHEEEGETACLLKGLMAEDSSGDMFHTLGLPRDKWDGFTLDRNVKASNKKLANLETITLNASPIRGINIRPDATSSKIGVQGTCLNPVAYRNLVVEMGQVEKAQVFKRAVEGDLEAIEQVIGEIDPEDSFEDSDTILIKILGDVIKENGVYRESRHVGLRNVTAARKTKYWTEKVLKMKVAPLILYSNKLPVVLYYNPAVSKSAMTLVDACKALSVPFIDGIIDFSSPEYVENVKPYADDALSIWEQMEFAETGHLKNYMLFHEEQTFRSGKESVSIYRHYEAFNNMAAYRNPVVGLASMQDNYIPGPELAKWLMGMGFKSVGITKDGKYSCHYMPDIAIGSQDQAVGKFEDNDGDFTFLMFSNTASFGAHRPELPPELAKGKDIVPTTPRELNELNRMKYSSIIDHAAVTGILDLVVRSIIEYYRSNGHELPANWKYWMAWVREWLAIKGIKHTTLEKGEMVELPQDLVIRRVMQGKKLPPAYMIPETALKHPRIGRSVGSSSSNKMLMDICRQIKAFNAKEDKVRAGVIKLRDAGKLTEKYLDNVIATRDPYIDVFRSLNGINYSPVNEWDSQTLKLRYRNLWDRIVKGEKVLPMGYSIGPVTISAVVNFANRMNRAYGNASIKYQAFPEEDRTKAFTQLKQWFLEQLGEFLTEQVGRHHEGRETICNALTVYFGTITFGYAQGDRRSGSGSLKYWMGFESNLAICEILTPDNPYIPKLRGMVVKAMAKRLGAK